MKTYILDILNKIKRFSQKLDATTIICNRSWYLFNDEGIKSLYIFQEDGTVYVTNNGIVENGTWKFITANQSIILTIDGKSYMLKPAFSDENILALNLDGTDTYSFFIDENNLKAFAPKTLTELQEYFLQIQIQNDPELKKIADQKAEEERRILEQQKDAEREKHYAHFCEIMKECKVSYIKQLIIALAIYIMVGAIISIFRENEIKALIIIMFILAMVTTIFFIQQDQTQTKEKLKNYLINNKEIELVNFIQSDKKIRGKIGDNFSYDLVNAIQEQLTIKKVDKQTNQLA